MRSVPAAMQAAWRSGDYIGSQRPMVRATIQQGQTYISFRGYNVYASSVFGATQTPMEMPNIKSLKWSRSVDQDSATMTLELYNTAPLPIGTLPSNPSRLDQPGFYTPTRGQSDFSSRWKQQKNQWANLLRPENYIRTYEGYGFDATKIPELDPNLVSSGFWRIDDVEFGSDALITIQARDLSSIMQDEIVFPPVVPRNFYPLAFSADKTANPADLAFPTSTPPQRVVPTVTHPVKNKPVPLTMQRLPLSFSDSSITPYVGRLGSVFGHVAQDAFDGNDNSYWLSVGNARNDEGYSYEWIEGSLGGTEISQVRFTTVGKNYFCYVSVFANGSWQGSTVIPYDPTNPNSRNASNIPYIETGALGNSEGQHHITFKPVDNATKVRITFHNLQHFDQLDPSKPYRAAVREFSAYGLPKGSKMPVQLPKGAGENPGYYRDYTDIVKLFCAWGGFYWPNASQGDLQANFVRSDGSLDPKVFSVPDPVLGSHSGRVWGDFEFTGTYGSAKIPLPQWDKKPLIDGINYIRDIIGFHFFVDEDGGVVWRSPNIFRTGNYVGTASSQKLRTQEVVTIDEMVNLVNLKVKISGRNSREKIFIAATDGRTGAVVPGYSPNPVGLRRVAGWTDQFFASKAECARMADFIGIRQLLDYRQDTVVIPGFPKIQIDDQVRIFEEVTAEGYLHYVRSISSTNDLETGAFTYTLTTNWLGTRPDLLWAFKPDTLADETKTYLSVMGLIEPLAFR